MKDGAISSAFTRFGLVAIVMIVQQREPLLWTTHEKRELSGTFGGFVRRFFFFSHLFFFLSFFFAFDCESGA